MDVHTATSSPSSERAHRAAVAGFAFAVLDAVAILVVARAPSVDAADRVFVSFYADRRERQILIATCVYVIPLAGIAFMWFLAALRHRTLRAAGMEDPLLSTVQLMSGVVFVAVLFVAAASAVSIPAAIELGGNAVVDVDGARQQTALFQSLFLLFGVRAGAVFMAAGTVRARRATLLPPWFTTLSMGAVAVLMILATYSERLSLIVPVWVGCVSLFVLRFLPNAESPVAA